MTTNDLYTEKVNSWVGLSKTIRINDNLWTMYSAGFDNGVNAERTLSPTYHDEKVEKLVKFIKDVSTGTQISHTTCDNGHSYYSSMHPNADVLCSSCGRSLDSMGGPVSAREPTPLAKKALEVLRELDIK